MLFAPGWETGNKEMDGSMVKSYGTVRRLVRRYGSLAVELATIVL